MKKRTSAYTFYQVFFSEILINFFSDSFSQRLQDAIYQVHDTLHPAENKEFLVAWEALVVILVESIEKKH